VFAALASKMARACFGSISRGTPAKKHWSRSAGDEWFRVFDKKNLALLVQEKTEDGKRSNFNKLVSRETIEAR
jgi:hypothetical protein